MSLNDSSEENRMGLHCADVDDDAECSECASVQCLCTACWATERFDNIYAKYDGNHKTTQM